jgi:hypothetical protein
MSSPSSSRTCYFPIRGLWSALMDEDFTSESLRTGTRMLCIPCYIFRSEIYISHLYFYTCLVLSTRLEQYVYFEQNLTLPDFPITMPS